MWLTEVASGGSITGHAQLRDGSYETLQRVLAPRIIKQDYQFMKWDP